jgi:hypothetical protein
VGADAVRDLLRELRSGLKQVPVARMSVQRAAPIDVASARNPSNFGSKIHSASKGFGRMWGGSLLLRLRGPQTDL